jgi:cyanophycin synthetase
MASVAAAWATGLDWEVIRAGLRTFSNDSDNAPGRFNIFSYRGATVIADYGHNPDAMLALVRAVDTLPARRRSVVISGAGDRRDDDIRQQTRILGDVFDDVLLYQGQCQRGREDGEVIALLRQGLEGASRTSDIREIRGEFHAIDTAMSKLDAGDLCLILVDQIEQVLVVRVGVDGGHAAGADPEPFMKHLGHRRQAVRRARSVGDNSMLRWIEGRFVDPDTDGDVSAVRGS